MSTVLAIQWLVVHCPAGCIRASKTDRKLAVFHWCREGRGAGTGQDVISNVHAVTSNVFPPLTVGFITVSKTDRQLSIICQFKEERGAGTAWDLSMCGWDVRSRHLQCMCTAALTVCVHYTVCSVSTLPCVVCVHYNRWYCWKGQPEFRAMEREAGDVWCFPPCLKSHGCHLIPLFYLLSCSSAQSCYSFFPPAGPFSWTFSRKFFNVFH